jgi:hypothetical protein
MNSTLEHVYATLIVGSDTDLFDAMKVDADGNVYVAGSPFSGLSTI